MVSRSYSFADITATYVGPGGTFSIGAGAGPSEEGITVTQTDDKGSLAMGADGQGMHSLHVAQNGTVTVRLLKTSEANAILNQAYNTETQSAALYGNGTIVIRDAVRGDVITCAGCGWRKMPDVGYGKDGGMYEWVWNAAQIFYNLGTGSPARI